MIGFGRSLNFAESAHEKAHAVPDGVGLSGMCRERLISEERNGPHRFPGKMYVTEEV
jgi:hypothetical protein